MGLLRSFLRAIMSPGAVGAWPPGHFYSPIPNRKTIDRESVFDDNRPLDDIALRVAAQLDLLEELGAHWKEIPESPGSTWRYNPENDQFGLMDAYILFCMIARLNPSTIMEVGSGHSSALMLDALEIMGSRVVPTLIEPFPERLLGLLRPGDLRGVEIIENPVQTVPLSRFAKLGERDILFIDSSHVSKIGSDVNHLLFSVLPSLRKGVVVHFHDILYPFEYKEAWIDEGRFWNESYMVRSFLAYNSHFHILLFNDYLWKYHAEAFEQSIPRACQHSGSSLWIERIAE